MGPRRQNLRLFVSLGVALHGDDFAAVLQCLTADHGSEFVVVCGRRRAAGGIGRCRRGGERTASFVFFFILLIFRTRFARSWQRRWFVNWLPDDCLSFGCCCCFADFGRGVAR
jgi:hypothetical protein